MNFIATTWVETRSDNSDLKGYKVYLDNKIYVLYYDKNTLREVYFMSEYPRYFMSCRTDMKTISHYFYDATGKIIKRYENGQPNRTYTIINSRLTTCNYAGVERRYESQHINLDQAFQDKLYNDLVNFLDQFISLGLTELFSPKELIN